MTYVLLDVRQPAELTVEHVPGAVNIPLPELRARLSSRWAGTIPVQFSFNLTLANLCYLRYNGGTGSDH